MKKFVDHFVSVFGITLQMHLNKGTNYESEVFKAMCIILGFEKTRTIPFRLQSDGLVEQANRMIQSMLSKFVSNHKKDWDEYLPILSLAYNSSMHDSTGYCPSIMMFERHLNLPIDSVTGQAVRERQ